MNYLNATVNADKDERWEKPLERFAAIETQLQEFYWEVLDYVDVDAQPQ